MAEIDFEAEGLLDGLEGKAREARLGLLEDLTQAGVPLEDLRRAVEQDRLALLPVEHILGGEPKYTTREIAELTGMEVEVIVAQWKALGLPVPELDERTLTDEDLAAARRAKAFWDAGLPPEGLLEVSRVIGMAMSQVAAANRGLIVEAFLRPGDTERDVGLRFAAAAQGLRPLLGPTLEYVFSLHLREQIRQDVIGRAQIEAGELPGASEVAVAFVDMVGFTRLGERLAADELGALTGRLNELAAAAAQPPVRLVKTIGDAAMLVAPEAEALLDSALALVESVEEEESLPPVKAGAAWGPALPRGGDWYGRPVNLASRITGAARPASVLVSAELAGQAGEGFRFSKAGRRWFKGIKGEVELLRARRLRDA